MQKLHFAHHRHAGYNFAVIDFFWDKILGTYRRPVKKLSDSLPQKCDKGLNGVVKNRSSARKLVYPFLPYFFRRHFGPRRQHGNRSGNAAGGLSAWASATSRV
jgi:hypothetical protein